MPQFSSKSKIKILPILAFDYWLHYEKCAHAFYIGEQQINAIYCTTMDVIKNFALMIIRFNGHKLFQVEDKRKIQCIRNNSDANLIKWSI